MSTLTDTPFDPDNDSAYAAWRDTKLQNWQDSSTQVVQINDPAAISTEEYEALSEQMQRHNMAMFRMPAGVSKIDNDLLKSLGSQLGLNRLDSNLYANESDISELRVIDKGRRGEYIPYTNRALGWHTDGYYNHPDKSIRSFILYCVSEAETGGNNHLLDPDLAYIHVRDHGKELVRALMRPDTFIIPETVEEGKRVRDEQPNPVFQIDPLTGKLLMRYTQRKTHIHWQQDDDTQQALSLLGDLLDSNTAHILSVRLNAGEGLVCNNVLHNRSAFTDSQEQPRIMLRARYYDRFREYSEC